MKLKKLFEPILVGNMELKNRIVMLPMGNLYDKNYQISDRNISYFIERAKGGAGLLTVPSIFPADYEGTHPIWPPNNPLGMLAGGWNDNFVEGFGRLTDSLHNYGAKVAAQLSLMYEWRKDKKSPMEVVGPSDGVEQRNFPAPRELTPHEIEQICDQFGDTAKRMRDAGFDAAEIHSGNGYLSCQFLSPSTNMRTDEYGGSLENRMRFLLKIIDCCKKKAGEDWTYIVRISGEELMANGEGLQLDETAKMVARLERAGIAAINAQNGTEKSPTPLIQQWVPQAAHVYVAEAFKKVVNIPIMATMMIKDPFVAEKILADGKADLIGVGRALLADPQWPNKSRTGKFSDIRPCITCCRCLDDALEGKPVSCSVNARLGKELEYPAYTQTQAKKKVLVVGGGPAGMEAARVAALRGHVVTICDQGPRLGGLILLGAIINSQLESLLKYMCRQIRNLPITFIKAKKVTAGFVEKNDPDVIVLALGGHAPAVEAQNLPSLLTSSDICKIIQGRISSAGKAAQGLPWYLGSIFIRYFYWPSFLRWLLSFNFPFGKKVSIIGGGYAGCSLAYFLTLKGKKVEVIEESPALLSDMGITTKWVLRKKLKEGGVRMITGARVERMMKNGIEISQAGVKEFLESDKVMLIGQLQANTQLATELRSRGKELYFIGDGNNPAKIKEAISSGFTTGMDI